ncbi:vesicle transport through interaction with t-SNAREs homolog 1A-like isoform X2 [Petromyzon marinus]|uniref:vesicle transport through interaction with t-SNAREs homolog 1A-like isoform X2 n=1 Tax=Petromyzon marinus TaxID=7757 RepID=UPI003F709649
MELADLLLQEVDALLVGAACRVALLPRLLRDDKEELVASIEKDIGDARELLEQLDLAGWEMDAKRRKRHQELVKTKGEAVTQLQKDYVSNVLRESTSIWRARISYRDLVMPWAEVLEEGAEANLSENLKVQLVENTVRLDNGTRTLEIAYLTCTETEQIGLDVTRHLQKDTEKMQLLQDTQRHLKCSKYVQNRIVNRSLQNCALAVALAVFTICAVALCIYLALHKRNHGAPLLPPTDAPVASARSPATLPPGTSQPPM